MKVNLEDSEYFGGDNKVGLINEYGPNYQRVQLAINNLNEVLDTDKSIKTFRIDQGSVQFSGCFPSRDGLWTLLKANNLILPFEALDYTQEAEAAKLLAKETSKYTVHEIQKEIDVMAPKMPKSKKGKESAFIQFNPKTRENNPFDDDFTLNIKHDESSAEPDYSFKGVGSWDLGWID